jgi:hypothetical protein
VTQALSVDLLEEYDTFDGKMELFFVLSSLSKFSRFCSVSAATTVSPLQVMTIPQKMLLPKE